MTRSLDYSAFRGTKFFRNLDGLRFLSIVAVVWDHAWDYLHGYPRFDWLEMGFLRRGRVGVDLFFVISGFLIVTLLLREREGYGSISLRNFYVRRTLRIFPIYYLLILVFCAYHLYSQNTFANQAFFDALPYYLTYTSNFIHHEHFLALAWSLACEEQFYLAWPQMERNLSRGTITVALLLFLGANQLVNFGVFDEALARYSAHALDLNVVRTTFTPIILGVFLAHLLHDERSFRLVRRILGHPATVWASLVAIVLLIVLPESLRGAPRFGLHVAMVFLVGSCVLQERHAVGRFLTLPPVVRIGVISYGIYLYHLIALRMSMKLLSYVDLQRTLWIVPVTLAISVAIAELSFRLIEAPILGLKDRLQTPRVRRSPSSPGLASPTRSASR